MRSLPQKLPEALSETCLKSCIKDCQRPASKVASRIVRGLPQNEVAWRTASIPFGSIPYGSIPFGSIPYGSTPRGGPGLFYNIVLAVELEAATPDYWHWLSNMSGSLSKHSICEWGSPFDTDLLTDLKEGGGALHAKGNWLFPVRNRTNLMNWSPPPINPSNPTLFYTKISLLKNSNAFFLKSTDKRC